jgi:drug/metabolite transporter (DMT)-like permease
MKSASFRPNGALLALVAALLFGASTPISKLLLRTIEPLWLAGLLYFGSGLGLATWMLVRRWAVTHRSAEASLTRHDWPWLAGSIFAGGVLAPVLLVLGLRSTAASSASLLLNFEGAFTVLIAWILFRENFDRRILVGMLAILAGGILLSWEALPSRGLPWAAMAIIGACLCWAIDNNLTRRVSAADPVQIAMLKGLVAGSVNLALAALFAKSHPSPGAAASAAVVGFFSYGVSLTCFVLALRHLGTARASAYFSVAPFVGAALSLGWIGESPSPTLMLAGACMAIGVWLHLTEHHEHLHAHEPMEHEHLHFHDAHHRHAHSLDAPPGEPHSHPHQHEALTHSHPHVPDIHHRHHHKSVG